MPDVARRRSGTQATKRQAAAAGSQRRAGGMLSAWRAAAGM